MDLDVATAARAAGATRAAIGAALLVAPGLVGGSWLGDVSRRPETQVAVSALGIRDLVLGVGTVWALGGRRRDARPWLIGGGTADLSDLVSTLRARRALSAPSVIVTAALAGGSAALHAWLQSELGRGAQ